MVFTAGSGGPFEAFLLQSLHEGQTGLTGGFPPAVWQFAHNLVPVLSFTRTGCVVNKWGKDVDKKDVR